MVGFTGSDGFFVGSVGFLVGVGVCRTVRVVGDAFAGTVVLLPNTGGCCVTVDGTGVCFTEGACLLDRLIVVGAVTTAGTVVAFSAETTGCFF